MSRCRRGQTVQEGEDGPQGRVPSVSRGASGGRDRSPRGQGTGAPGVGASLPPALCSQGRSERGRRWERAGRRGQGDGRWGRRGPGLAEAVNERPAVWRPHWRPGSQGHGPFVWSRVSQPHPLLRGGSTWASSGHGMPAAAPDVWHHLLMKSRGSDRVTWPSQKESPRLTV